MSLSFNLSMMASNYCYLRVASGYGMNGWFWVFERWGWLYVPFSIDIFANDCNLSYFVCRIDNCFSRVDYFTVGEFLDF